MRSLLLMLFAAFLPARLPGQEGVNIYWDVDSIPYIESATDRGVFYGQGYAMGRCRGPNLKRQYQEFIGDSAVWVTPLFGTDSDPTPSVELDFDMRQAGVPELVDQIESAMDEPTRELLRAFA